MKFLLSLALLVFSISECYANQLTLLTKSQAEKAVAFLKDNNINEAIIWCGCCANEPMKKIQLSKTYSRFSGTDDFYEVVFVGKFNNGEIYNSPIDLANVHLRSGNEAKNFGIILGLKSNPCTLPFLWAQADQNTQEYSTNPIDSIAYSNNDIHEDTASGIEATFPGGLSAWKRYLERNLDGSLAEKYINLRNGQKTAVQTAIVSFTIDEYGNISKVGVENSRDIHPVLAAEAIRVVSKSGKWIPASKNGKNVKYRMRQNISWRVSK